MLPVSGKPGGGLIIYFFSACETKSRRAVCCGNISQGLALELQHWRHFGLGQQENGVRWDAGKDVHQLVEWAFSFFFLYFSNSPWDSCLCGHGLAHQDVFRCSPEGTQLSRHSSDEHTLSGGGFSIYSMRVSIDVFSSLSVAVKGGWKNPRLFLGLWKHLHRRGERKICPMSVFWESRQGHDGIVKASPAFCLDVPATSKESRDEAVPEAVPAKGPLGRAGHRQLPEPGPPSHSCSCVEKTAFSSQHSPAMASRRPFLLHWWEDWGFFLGMGSSSTQTPSVLPRSAPSSPSTREGAAKLEDGGQRRRLGLPAHLLCVALVLPGQLCVAQHAAVVLLNQPERSCTVPVLNPALESGAGHHLM